MIHAIGHADLPLGSRAARGRLSARPSGRARAAGRGADAFSRPASADAVGAVSIGGARPTQGLQHRAHVHGRGVLVDALSGIRGSAHVGEA